MIDLPQRISDEIVRTVAADIYSGLSADDTEGIAWAQHRVRTTLTAGLTALYGVCDVREELGVRITWNDGDPDDDLWLNDQAAIDRAVAHPGTGLTASRIRRLVITTPPSPLPERGRRPMAEHSEELLLLIEQAILRPQEFVQDEDATTRRPYQTVAKWASHAVPVALARAGYEVILKGPDNHIIEFREDGWTLQHPLSCRPNLFACPANRAAVKELTGPPAALGCYECRLEDDVLVIGERVVEQP